MAEAPPDTEFRPAIDWGWVLIEPLSAVQRDAVERARDQLKSTLQAAFPGYRWSMPLHSQPRSEPPGQDEPALRLAEGFRSRDEQAWDFAFVITSQDLRSHYKSYALAVPSRALAVAVLSLARLAASPRSSVDELSSRLVTLALHLFGDLNGLWHRDASGTVMHPPQAVGDLDQNLGYDESERALLGRALAEVADLRLEEDSRASGRLRFYLRATWERRAEIFSAVMQARPWEFPLRLPKLTTAAASSLLLLMITAEVWDLGTSQHPLTILALSTAFIASTTVFVLLRQKLILRRLRSRASEQSVVTNVAAVSIVLLGMVTTFACLFVLALGLGWTLFDASLVARWAPATAGRGLHDLPVLAGLVASLGLAVGALGASLERRHAFWHVIYADEET